MENILDFVRTNLEGCTLSEIDTVAAFTQIPAPTLIKIKYGTTDNPRIKTIQPLLTYFQKRKRKAA